MLVKPRGGLKYAIALGATLVGLAAPQPAQAAIPSVLGGDVACTVQGDGVRFCGSSSPRSTSKAFDGVPLDVNVAFPPEPATGTDGNYPLVMLFHGYGGGKIGLSTMQRWLDRGYATFSMTARGFRESCGSAAAQAADPAGCAAGFVRLDDTRYEVRDAQEFAGRLADAALIDPTKIAAIGGSYGGGISLALATLRNRKMLPDGSLVTWTSPNGTAMEIAAAAPFITWSDLAYSLAPNGSTLDYVAASSYEGRFGVMKESLVNGLYISGQGAPGFYAPPGTAGADLTGWKTLLDAGEPYDGNPAAQAILDELTSHHSAYYIGGDVEPAPILFSNGFTDDLFPADEAVRFYNKVRSDFPDAIVSLFFGEIAGHPRSTSKAVVNDRLRDKEDAWFDHFVKGLGEQPFTGVEAFTQTCPNTAAPGGPFQAKTWARISPGEIRASSKPAATIAATAGDNAIAATFDPVTGGGACAQAPGADQAGAMSLRLEPAPVGGFTMLGSPTVIAKFTLPGDNSQVAARLLDVAPDGQERLIARGLWRPVSGGPQKQVFQLHPNAWHFDEGHIVKLELLPADSAGTALSSYGRKSNGQQDVIVSNLKLRIPVRERPGARDGLVAAPAPKFLPKGYKLAPDYEGRDPRAKLAQGALRVKGSKLVAKVKCPRQFETCADGVVDVSSRGGNSKRSFKVASGNFDVAGGAKKSVKLELSARGRKVLANRGLRVAVEVTSAETMGAATQNRRVRR